jgi:hypothetical protein
LKNDPASDDTEPVFLGGKLGSCRKPSYQGSWVGGRRGLLGKGKEGCSNQQSSANENHFHPV